jgi:hypothetical protein
MTSPLVEPRSLRPSAETLSVMVPTAGWSNALGLPDLPADWADPTARSRRIGQFIEVALATADVLVEMILTLPAERQAGCDPLGAGGSAWEATEALAALERARHRYVRETKLYDFESVIRDAVGGSHGAAVAALTLQGMAIIRDAIERRCWERHAPGEHTDEAWQKYKDESERLRRELDARAAARRAAKARREGRLPR